MARGVGGAGDSLKKYLGSEVSAVARELKGKPNYSEFKLAEAIHKEVNETRNLLYRLHDLNLASFIKKKDHKIGWYIHYWTLHEERVPEFLLREKRKQAEQIKERLGNEHGAASYLCVNKCASLDFDTAAGFSYHCPECGELLVEEDKKEDTADLKLELSRLERDIALLETEVSAGREKMKRKNEEVELKAA